MLIIHAIVLSKTRHLHDKLCVGYMYDTKEDNQSCVTTQEAAAVEKAQPKKSI